MSRPTLPELTTGSATRAAGDGGGGGREEEEEEEDAVKDRGPKPVVPLLRVSAGGGVHEIQTFAHYVGTRARYVVASASFASEFFFLPINEVYTLKKKIVNLIGIRSCLD